MDATESAFADVCAAINYGVSFHLTVPDVWVARRTLLARELGIPPYRAEDAEFDTLDYMPEHPGFARMHTGATPHTRIWYHDLSGTDDTDTERCYAQQAYERLLATAPSAAPVSTPLVRPWWEEVQEA